MIRVVVADDHNLVREGICSLLERADGISVVGQAADGREAVALVEQLAPDALVIDVSMPCMDGIQATRQVCSHSVTKVVILSVYGDRPLVRQALRNGASAYVLKKSIPAELVMAIRAAARGETFLSPAVSDTVIEGFLDGADEIDAVVESVTPRERQVLQLIAEGHTNRSTADVLGISVKTVEKHRASLLKKLSARGTSGLIREAMRYRLVLPE